MAQLLFFADGHTYELDGKKIPSVTQLVAPLGDDIDDEFMDGPQMAGASERGNVMHAYIAHRLCGGEADEFELPTEYENYAEAVELFLKEHSPVPLAIETPVYIQYGDIAYAGTPDLVTHDGAIFDWKFVSQICKPKVGAQLNGYRIIWDLLDFPIRALAAIQFLPDGTYRYYPVASRKDGFDCCVKLFTEKAKNHPKGAIS